MEAIINFLDKEKIEFTTDKRIIEKESRDWSWTSSKLSQLDSKLPLVVVYPKNEDEIIKIVEFSKENHLPVVPKGKGFNNVGGLIITKPNSILINLTYFSGILEENDQLIKVKSGTPYYKKGKFLFLPRVYPSTFRHEVTIGGNFCGGAYGIGSYEYGPNWDQVIEIEMISPKGKKITLYGNDTRVAAHALGTTGIVTSLKLLKRQKEGNDIVKVFFFDNFKELLKLIDIIYDSSLPYYHVNVLSPNSLNIIDATLPKKWALITVYPEDRKTDVLNGGTEGRIFWEHRDLFNSGLIEKLVEINKNIDYSVYKLDIYKIDELLNKIKTENFFIEINFTNERKGRMLLASFDKIPELGNTEFDVNSPYVNSRVKFEHLHRIKMFKVLNDPEDLFNPNKLKFY
ncbi:MAG: FAD-binding oxidoreductase [Sulfolobus sp.]|jgi:FAD/FMN-containing dehydrogenase